MQVLIMNNVCTHLGNAALLSTGLTMRGVCDDGQRFAECFSVIADYHSVAM